MTATRTRDGRLRGEPLDRIFDRAPPHDVAAEQAVLGSMLLDNTTIPAVLGTIGPDAFLRDAHSKVLGAIRDL